MSRILTLSYSFLFLRRFICTLAKFAIFFHADFDDFTDLADLFLQTIIS